MASELWQRLRAIRDFADQRQDDVAAICGVSRGAVAQWESKNPSNRNRPSVEQVSAIAKSTGVPVEWILNDAVDTTEVWKIGKVFGSPVKEPMARRQNDAPHNKLLEAFKKAVEFEVLTREPDLAEGFEVPIGHGTVAVMADFCCARCVTVFAMGDEATNPEVAGRLLLLERASGKSMSKVLIQCGAGASAPEITEYMMTAFGIKVVQVSSPAEAAEYLVGACY